MPWASGLDPTLKCPASAVLPKVREPSGPEAERGVVIHKFLENVIALGRDKALELVPADYRVECAMVDVDALLAGLSNIRCEETWVVDVLANTARLDDGAEPTDAEFRGRFDLIATNTEGVPVGADYKTGRDLGDIMQLYQLRLLGLALHLATGQPWVEIRAKYIEPDGAVRIKSELLGPSDHDETLKTLRGLRAKILKAAEQYAQHGAAGVAVSTGDHCRFCKCIHQCPSKMQFIARTLPDLEFVSDSIDILDPAAIGIAWTKLREVKDLLARVEPVINEMTKRVAPVPLPNGKVLKFVDKTTKALNHSRLIQLAKNKGAADDEIAKCYTSNRFQVGIQTKSD